VALPPKSWNIEVGKQLRRPLPGNGSMSSVPVATSALEMESTCCLGMKARSRDNADVASKLDAVTSETQNRTLREGVF
jgi:hypothetical protein